MAERTIGVDASKWQGWMDWNKTAQAGAKFAFIRAGSINNTTGICYTDYQFEVNQVAASYMPVGFYWYFRPNHDPIKQANYFCGLIENKDWKMRPVLDLENTGGLSPQQTTDESAEFVLQVNHNLGVIPELYSRAYWLNTNTVADDLMKLLDLWIARYTTKGKPWGNLLPWPDSPRIKPRDYNDWVFWQFSADGNGRGPEFGASSKSIDLDYFNGDEAKFHAYIHTDVPNPRKFYIVSEPTGANIIATVTGVKIGLVPYGTFLFSEEEPGQWVKVGEGYVNKQNLKEVT